MMVAMRAAAAIQDGSGQEKVRRRPLCHSSGSWYTQDLHRGRDKLVEEKKGSKENSKVNKALETMAKGIPSLIWVDQNEEN